MAISPKEKKRIKLSLFFILITFAFSPVFFSVERSKNIFLTFLVLLLTSLLFLWYYYSASKLCKNKWKVRGLIEAFYFG